MKMTINRAKFIEALGNVRKVLPSKSAVPVLGCVEINAVSEDVIELVGTDMATNIKVTCPCVEGEGRFLVNCEKIASVASVMVGENITISSVEGENRILVTDGKSKYHMTIVVNEVLPAVFGNTMKFCTATVENLRDAFGEVLFAVDKKQSNAPGTYPGVFFDIVDDSTVNLVATDRRKLAVCRLAVEDVYNEDDEKVRRSFFLPVRSANIAKNFCKEGKCEISRFNHMVTFKFDGIEFNTTLIGTPFPNYTPILEAAAGADNRLDIHGADLCGIIRRATVLNNGVGQKVVKIELAQNRMVVSSTDKEYGNYEEEMLCGYTGADLAVMVDPDAFCEMLNAFVNPDVVVMLRNESAPLHVASGNTVVIFMPCH